MDTGLARMVRNDWKGVFTIWIILKLQSIEQVYSERGASSRVMTNMIIFLTILVYGVNFLAYMYIKIKEIKNYLEKIAIYFGVNMTLLFTSSIFLFFGKIVEDGILLIE